MTNKEIIENLKVGSVVTSLRLLSSLYRKGLIGGYSEWGYLESAYVYYKYEWEGRIERVIDRQHLFPMGNRDKVANNDYTFESLGEMRKVVGDDIIYMGCRFTRVYLDGCFKPYLQLVEKFGDKEKEVNPTICDWGAIM